MYTRPLATDKLVKWLKVAIWSPLDQSSAPVRASSAYSVACDECATRLAAELYARPISTVACVGSSPLPYANTTPLAITTGSALIMLRDSQAGTSSSPDGRRW